MKKEILTAILLGLTIGLILTGIYFFSQSRNSSTPTEMYNPLIEDYLLTNNSKIKFANGQSHQITLINPPDQSVTSQNQTTITGQTTPESIVTILGENSEKSIIADNQGNFETTINLIGGENEIVIKSFSPSSSVTDKTITVVVSSFEF